MLRRNTWMLASALVCVGVLSLISGFTIGFRYYTHEFATASAEIGNAIQHGEISHWFAAPGFGEPTLARGVLGAVYPGQWAAGALSQACGFGGIDLVIFLHFSFGVISASWLTPQRRLLPGALAFVALPPMLAFPGMFFAACWIPTLALALTRRRPLVLVLGLTMIMLSTAALPGLALAAVAFVAARLWWRGVALAILSSALVAAPNWLPHVVVGSWLCGQTVLAAVLLLAYFFVLRFACRWQVSTQVAIAIALGCVVCLVLWPRQSREVLDKPIVACDETPCARRIIWPPQAPTSGSHGPLSYRWRGASHLAKQSGSGPLLDMFATRASAALDMLGADTIVVPRTVFLPSGLTKEYDIGDWVVARGDSARARGFRLSSWQVDRTGVADFGRGRYRSRHGSLSRLPSGYPPAPSLSDLGRGNCRVVRRVNSYELRCYGPAASVAVLTQQSRDGWRGAVDGAAAETLTVDGTFVAVAIPAGNSTARFTYSTPTWTVSRILSALGGGLLLLLVLVRRRIVGPSLAAVD